LLFGRGRTSSEFVRISKRVGCSGRRIVLELVFEVASGRRTKNELDDQRDIGIFKDGVTL
jgi:altronate dehydratase